MRVLIIGVAALLAVGLAAELALIQPADLAAQLAAKGASPAIFHVGPNLLYRGKHIPGAIYAGPGSKPEGLEALKVAAGKLPRDREIIVLHDLLHGLPQDVEVGLRINADPHGPGDQRGEGRKFTQAHVGD